VLDVSIEPATGALEELGAAWVEEPGAAGVEELGAEALDELVVWAG
jgi:hypothetical protein